MIVSFSIFLVVGALALLQCAGVAWAGVFLYYSRHVRRHQARVSACPSPPAGNLVVRHDIVALVRDFAWLRATPAILCCPLCGEQCEAVFDQYVHEVDGLLVGVLSHRCGAPEVDEYVVSSEEVA